MAGRVGIGEFSTMTRLSRKALRMYHELGLLTPAAVDPFTGYRSYGVEQVDLARRLRRFRELDMPVAELRAWVAAPDDAGRDQVLAAHLARMEHELDRTRAAVTALRALVEPAAALAVSVRDEPERQVVSVTGTVVLADVVAWWTAAGEELTVAGAGAGGPLGATFAHALFADEEGEVRVWLPAGADVAVSGRVREETLPGGRFAVAVHDGPDERIDETYAALGRWVAERGTGADGPVRERYLAGALGDPRPLVTEIAWPLV